MSIYEYLNNFREISFHMPGHKGRIPVPIIDVTELSGTDNLMCPAGIIKEAQENMAKRLGKKTAFFLTNGASSGILAGIFAVTRENETVLVDRNCHVSVLNGLILSGAVPKFIYPEVNPEFQIPRPISAKDFSYEGEKAVIITSPTYYGEVSDMDAIRKAVGEAVILQDESHGAHFYFSDSLKPYGNCVSDLSVLSFHKTMPTLNQGAVLVRNTDAVPEEMLKRAVNMVTTTSPSYPILSSLDYAGIYGKELYGNIEIQKEIKHLKAVIREETPFRLLTNQDFYKLLINCDGCSMTALEIQKHLEEKFRIYVEGVFGNNLLVMISPCNTTEELKILADVLTQLPLEKTEVKSQPGIPVFRLQQKISPREAFFAEGELIPVSQAVGRVSKENIVRFPPCVPLVTVGEEITEDVISYLEQELIAVVK